MSHVWKKRRYTSSILFLCIYFYHSFGNCKIMSYHYTTIGHDVATQLFFWLKSWQLIEIRILILFRTNSAKRIRIYYSFIDIETFETTTRRFVAMQFYFTRWISFLSNKVISFSNIWRNLKSTVYYCPLYLHGLYRLRLIIVY